ncbi:hypothetical protein BKA66DRAFT_414697 [Pyrenochaeta sp. MPI-SDFR-AT-0127]|nr:hypothetical protein BKA66DRAFT_414697 [Pyrenochaeta sp. MPI-SDFR-AT-0127]
MSSESSQEVVDTAVASQSTQPQSSVSSVVIATGPVKNAKPSILVEWRWEFFTWALGTVSGTAILVLLLSFKDKPLKLWSSPIQPAAIVAILSQISQSALIVSISACIGQSKWSWIRQKHHSIEIERFDEASRGPEGSLKLLSLSIWNPRTRRLFTGQSCVNEQ